MTDLKISKKILAPLLVIFFIIFAVELNVHAMSRKLSQKATNLRVLFIGNSLIGTKTLKGDDVPSLIQKISDIDGNTIISDKVINLGHSLQDTWDSNYKNSAGTAGVRELLDGRIKYDIILLQEYSTHVVEQPEKFFNTLLTTYYLPLKKSLSSKGKILLFKNWALADNPEIHGFKTRTEYIAMIDSNYEKLHQQLLLPNIIIPIGTAFENSVLNGWSLLPATTSSTNPASNYLIVSDKKHPSDSALYLEAIMIYSAVSGRNPVGLPPLYFPPETVQFLQKMAYLTLSFNVF